MAEPMHEPADQEVELVTGSALVEADPTPGVTRLRAFHTAAMWAGLGLTEPGAESGWHHHGDHETLLYQVSGQMRLESGPGGRHVVESGPGDFVIVPANTVHRESNPGGEVATVVVARAGSGPVTVNVDGPDPG